MLNKKIVISSNTSFSVYNFRLGLIKVLKEKGYDVNVVAPVDEFTHLLKREVKFYPINHLDRKGKNPIKDLRLLYEFFSLYKRLRPDLVINYTIKPNIYSSIACGLLGIPCISVVTGLGYVFVEKNFLTQIVKVLYKLAFRFNRVVIFLNEEDKNTLQHIISKAKCKIIPGSGVNTFYFSPDVCKDDKHSEGFVFLYIGRFLKDKGILELIYAGERLWRDGENFQIWLLGDIDRGNPNSLSKAQMEQISNYPFVKIFSFVKDVRPFICAAGCVVLPSYYREGIPRSLLEAMAMEKPIITTDAPGCRGVCIDGVNGFLVKPRDIESLYQAMKKVMNLSLKEITDMGKQGRKIILDKYDEQIIIKKYLDLINEIISKKLNSDKKEDAFMEDKELKEKY